MTADTDHERPRAAGSRASDVALWYHTIDLPGGAATPGWFDLRSIVERMPWPDVRGKRCLDVGTYDGFLAFELERRGAGEVVATDIADHNDWDWPARVRAQGGERLAALAGAEKGHGFRVARELLGSSVQRTEINVYELSPDNVGRFDVVVCGSLLIHLRDPVRALEAIRSVCGGALLSAEEIRVGLSILHRRVPVAALSCDDNLCQWWAPNASGHRRMIEMAGFDVQRQVRYGIPFGESHPPRRASIAERVRRGAQRAIGAGGGVPHSAVLAAPAL